MKTITIQINDEMAEILNKVAESSEFCKYPIDQAYRLIIKELISTMVPVSLCTCCCCCVPEHQHPPAWLLRAEE